MAVTMYGLTPEIAEKRNYNSVRHTIKGQNLKAAGVKPADLAEAGNLAGFGLCETVGSGPVIPGLVLARL